MREWFVKQPWKSITFSWILFSPCTFITLKQIKSICWVLIATAIDKAKLIHWKWWWKIQLWHAQNVSSTCDYEHINRWTLIGPPISTFHSIFMIIQNAYVQLYIRTLSQFHNNIIIRCYFDAYIWILTGIPETYTFIVVFCYLHFGFFFLHDSLKRSAKFECMNSLMAEKWWAPLKIKSKRRHF